MRDAALIHLKHDALKGLDLEPVQRELASVDALVLVNPAVAIKDPRLTLLPVLKHVVPSLPGIGNDIKMPGADGLEGPTATAIRHGKLYVLSAAFLLQKDPNILVADLDQEEPDTGDRSDSSPWHLLPGRGCLR